MAELSVRSGVSIPAIKFYLREQLLPPGRRGAPNQARYDEHHLRRLRLIRALLDVGGLSVAATRAVFEKVADPERSVHTALGAARHVVPGRHDDPAFRRAGDTVARLAERRHWSVGPDTPGIETLTEVIATFYRLDRDSTVARLLDDYAVVAEHLAEREIAAVADAGDLDPLAEGVVIGTVLGDVVLSALRRITHEGAWARRSGASPP